MSKHFRFRIFDAKQLTIALTGAFSTWAATGFQHDPAHLGYILVGFITGGLVSHESAASPSVTPESHIQTPYLANIDDGGAGPKQMPVPADPYVPEGTNVRRVIQINSGLIR